MVAVVAVTAMSAVSIRLIRFRNIRLPHLRVVNAD